MYDGSPVTMDDYKKIIYRAIIRGILEYYVPSDDAFAQFDTSTLEACQNTLVDVLLRFGGAYNTWHTKFNPNVYLWYGDCMNLCILGKCEKRTHPYATRFISKNRPKSTGNLLIDAALNTPDVFKPII